MIDGSEPLFGGLELCRRLRANPATARTRLLLVAAPDHGVHEARSSGADMVVSKPFSCSAIVARVRGLAETWSDES
ncbi:MAG: hypothetical protein QOD86_969 [Miltoncostaeaceae bacterium]|nr:hypothetical protein [Miltoncostaeaceae bacterium]